MTAASLLSHVDRTNLSTSHQPSESNPLLIEEIANRVYNHMIATWPDLPQITKAMQERYKKACQGAPFCAFAEGSDQAITSKLSLKPIANYPSLPFNPYATAARAFVEGLYETKDKDLIDHCIFMWNTDYQWGHQGKWPIMKRFLEGCDMPILVNDEEETTKAIKYVELRRKLITLMHTTNQLSIDAFNEPLGLFYQVDGKTLMSSEKPGSLFDRPVFWDWQKYKVNQQ